MTQPTTTPQHVIDAPTSLHGIARAQAAIAPSARIARAKAQWVAQADFSRPCVDLIDEFTEVLEDAGLRGEKAADEADRIVMTRLV